MAPPTPSSSTTSSSTSKGKTASRLQTHNAQHTLRAGSKQKQRQQQQQQRGQKGEEPAAAVGTGASTSTSTSSTAANPSTSSIPRKQTFKQVLASPLTVNWPQVASVDVQPVLYTLLDVLRHPVVKGFVRGAGTRGGRQQEEGKVEGAAGNAAGEDSKVSKAATATKSAKGKAKAKAEAAMAPTAAATSTTTLSPSRPLTIGINAVSRHLEGMIDEEAQKRKAKAEATRAATSSLSTDAGKSTDGNASTDTSKPTDTNKPTDTSKPTSPPPPSPPPLNIVFVCRQDLDPPSLCAHFPMLTCVVNAVCHAKTSAKTPSPGAGVLLIALPLGSERLISDALELRRCSVVGMSTDALADMGVRKPLLALLARIHEARGIAPLRAPWLDAAADVALRTREYMVARRDAATGSSRMSATALPPPQLPTPLLTPRVKQIATSAPTNLNAVKLAKKHTRREKKEWRKAVRKAGHQTSVERVQRERNRERRVRVKERVAVGRAAGGKKSGVRTGAAKDDVVMGEAGAGADAV